MRFLSEGTTKEGLAKSIWGVGGVVVLEIAALLNVLAAC